MKWIPILLALLADGPPIWAGQAKPESKRIILAIGAHAGDMEVAAGALLVKQSKAGDRVILLHLTLGEGGNPRLSPEEYGQQKRREAEAAAKALGGEVVFGPYKDGELPVDEGSRGYVAGVIRQMRPTHVITHWKNSLHKDHSAAHSIATEAVLLASLAGVKGGLPVHRGVRTVLFTENWEDKAEFNPYVYIDVSESVEEWEKCVKQYEFIRGSISRFPYFDYYRALLRVRGAECGSTYAEAFDIEPWGKRQIYRSLP